MEQEIENTKLYKILSNFSNKERGQAFSQYKTKIEKDLNVKLVKHSYAEFSKLKTNNSIMSYEDDSIIALMEFIPND